MSTYKVIELIGSSYTSWADAAKEALGTASKTLEDLRVAEVTKFDLKLEDGGRFLYRTRIQVSFKVQALEKGADVLGPKPYAETEEA
jgi:dodecin